MKHWDVTASIFVKFPTVKAETKEDAEREIRNLLNTEPGLAKKFARINPDWVIAVLPYNFWRRRANQLSAWATARQEKKKS